jgi:hypothetical protein
MLLSVLHQDAADALAQLRRHLDRWRFFQQLLMAPLDAALALTQAHHVAVLVGQHLKLDVARPLDELLHVEIAVAEGRPPPPTAPRETGWATPSRRG